MSTKFVIAEILLFSEIRGGRACMPVDSGYSPYVVVEGDSEFIDVIFIDVPEDAKPDSTFRQKIEIRYPNFVDLNLFKNGNGFQIFEGRKLIGNGVIVQQA
ncbi:MAG: hypothetical protein OEZ58_20130 [Gammaproteobacteria bacterium]|nr:hypothetical protein [Gammaproteobacteria bacterium]MDH5731300.1 hypothetical protein [Gammaproteobacteria bacterium]